MIEIDARAWQNLQPLLHGENLHCILKMGEFMCTMELSSTKLFWTDNTYDYETYKGHLHPLSQMIAEINSIFSEIGFVFAEGPEAELEYYNFDRLNVPKDHTSRDMQDTFWFKTSDVEKPMVLRTHTSPVQARYMESHTPPIRIIVPGKCFETKQPMQLMRHSSISLKVCISIKVHTSDI